ncbi:MAG TPA: hypothetical protein VGM28_10125 [Candidatus Limnocylindrales bacterium]
MLVAGVLWMLWMSRGEREYRSFRGTARTERTQTLTIGVAAAVITAIVLFAPLVLYRLLH